MIIKDSRNLSLNPMLLSSLQSSVEIFPIHLAVFVSFQWKCFFRKAKMQWGQFSHFLLSFCFPSLLLFDFLTNEGLLQLTWEEISKAKGLIESYKTWHISEYMDHTWSETETKNIISEMTLKFSTFQKSFWICAFTIMIFGILQAFQFFCATALPFEDTRRPQKMVV